MPNAPDHPLPATSLDLSHDLSLPQAVGWWPPSFHWTQEPGFRQGICGFESRLGYYFSSLRFQISPMNFSEFMAFSRMSACNAPTNS
jgi:hypothetical protein